MSKSDRKLTAEQQQLVAETFPRMRRLISKWAAAWQTPARFLDQLESAGSEGLCDAATRFDSAIAKWSSYWPHRVKGAIRDELRRIRCAGFAGAFPVVRSCGAIPVRSLSEPIPDLPSYGRSVVLGDFLADPDTVALGWEAEHADEARKISRLAGSPKARYAIEALLRGCETATLKAAAASVGLCESRLSQIRSELQAILLEHPQYWPLSRRIAAMKIDRPNNHNNHNRSA